MTERKRARFKPETPCLCGQRYDQHERRPGFGERPGRPPKLHCPGAHRWTRVVPSGVKYEYHFTSAWGPGLPAGGPWRVLPECTAPSHNTVRATESKLAPCICPHARDLVKEKARRRHSGNILVGAILTPLEHDVRPPDFSAGLCTLPINREVVDGGFSVEGSAAAMAKRMEAKRLCYACPLQESVCDPYVRAAEHPRGSWGGVWAGRDPWERQGKRIIAGQRGAVELVDEGEEDA